MEHRAGCLICGGNLVYSEEPRDRACAICGEVQSTTAVCEAGHFVCDQCHSLEALDLIEEFCITTTLEDPLAIACILMRSPAVRMHGPEHHFLVPAALITAYCNHRGEPGRKAPLLRQARARAGMVRGGFCGTHGTCGAAVGTGIFVSLITGSTPLKKQEWSLANQMTARSLMTIARHGGPRCCKRDSWLAILTATIFLEERFGITLPVQEAVQCEFSDINRECLREACPFHVGYPSG
ncbi:MAG: DUF5714 domain-containing protein [Candidatus Methanoculleus thermohydrogenotrophicum]|jgi:hypothetical protein